MYYVENPNPEEYDIVNHIDGDKMNNHYTNLEWCNISMNTQHEYDNNLVFDRRGLFNTPYSIRVKKKKENTERRNI